MDCHSDLSQQPTPEAQPDKTISSESDDQKHAQEALHCVCTLALEGDVDEALGVLRNECARAGPTELAAAYHSVIEAYVRQEKAEAALEVLNEMRLLGEECCHVLFATQEMVLNALAHIRNPSRANELLRAMCSSGCAPSDATFNSVVDTAVRARSYNEAWEALELLLNNKRRADKYFVSILTKSLESSNDRKWVRRGIQLVDKFIEQQRDDVDEIVFNSLLNVLGRSGDMPKLQQTLQKMHEYNVPPSAVTYGTVVKAYGRARDINAVLKVWSEMQHRCLSINPVTCGCVLDACVNCDHIDKAMAIFQEMRLQGARKNTVLYATLIKGLAKVRDLRSAIMLYQEMRMEGVPCNLVTFNSLMDVCVRCNDLTWAAMFLQDMIHMGIEPDLITFSTLIKGYSHNGDVQKALALARELKSRGLRCDEIMYNSLIDGCAKAKKLQEGLWVFEDMLNSRVVPSNITFSILVKLHMETGQVARAFAVIEEMTTKYRCTPSRVVYKVLLQCSVLAGRDGLQRGAALLIDLATKKQSKLVDHGMVSILLAGCVQQSDFETAVRVVQELMLPGARRGTGAVPLDSLKSLFEALGAASSPHGPDLLEHLRQKALPFTCLSELQSALQTGRSRAMDKCGGRMPNVVTAGTHPQMCAHATSGLLPPSTMPTFPTPYAPYSNWPSQISPYQPMQSFSQIPECAAPTEHLPGYAPAMGYFYPDTYAMSSPSSETCPANASSGHSPLRMATPSKAFQAPDALGTVPQGTLRQAALHQAPLHQAPLHQAPLPQAPQAPLPAAPLPQAPLPQAALPQAASPQAASPSKIPQASGPHAAERVQPTTKPKIYADKENAVPNVKGKKDDKGKRRQKGLGVNVNWPQVV